jgi:hypothetical protein
MVIFTSFSMSLLDVMTFAEVNLFANDYKKIKTYVFKDVHFSPLIASLHRSLY